MLATTFTEFRNQAKRFFDLVEGGETAVTALEGHPLRGQFYHLERRQ